MPSSRIINLTISTILSILSNATAASVHGPPTFTDSSKYTITTAGTHGNQGAHVITRPAIERAVDIAKAISPLKVRNGAGSVVTGAGLNWYTSNFNTGNAGYADTQYYYCFNGPASNFPPFGNWMNFYDMFDLNQQDSMVYEEDGPIQGDIWNAIVQVSANSLVDARFILAIIMQEVLFFRPVISWIRLTGYSQLAMFTCLAPTMVLKTAVSCKHMLAPYLSIHPTRREV